MVTTETIVPCLENDAHKLGAIAGTSDVQDFSLQCGVWDFGFDLEGSRFLS